MLVWRYEGEGEGEEGGARDCPPPKFAWKDREREGGGGGGGGEEEEGIRSDSARGV